MSFVGKLRLDSQECLVAPTPTKSFSTLLGNENELFCILNSLYDSKSPVPRPENPIEQAIHRKSDRHKKGFNIQGHHVVVN